MYGGFRVAFTAGAWLPDLAEEKQRDYLLRAQGGGGRYICGKPWADMPKTHMGGYVNDSVTAGVPPSLTVKWIRGHNFLPGALRERLARNRPGLYAACEGLEVPILYTLSTSPSVTFGEMFMKYGPCAGNHITGLHQGGEQQRARPGEPTPQTAASPARAPPAGRSPEQVWSGGASPDRRVA